MLISKEPLKFPMRKELRFRETACGSEASLWPAFLFTSNARPLFVFDSVLPSQACLYWWPCPRSTNDTDRYKKELLFRAVGLRFCQTFLSNFSFHRHFQSDSGTKGNPVATLAIIITGLFANSASPNGSKLALYRSHSIDFSWVGLQHRLIAPL